MRIPEGGGGDNGRESDERLAEALAGLRGKPAIYHCVSRIVNRDFVLERTEKERFVRLMRVYAQFCQVRVLTFCVMSNHFHILLEVPAAPEDGGASWSDEELLGHLSCLYTHREMEGGVGVRGAPRRVIGLNRRDATRNHGMSDRGMNPTATIGRPAGTDPVGRGASLVGAWEAWPLPARARASCPFPYILLMRKLHGSI